MRYFIQGMNLKGQLFFFFIAVLFKIKVSRVYMDCKCKVFDSVILIINYLDIIIIIVSSTMKSFLDDPEIKTFA